MVSRVQGYLAYLALSKSPEDQAFRAVLVASLRTHVYDAMVARHGA